MTLVEKFLRTLWVTFASVFPPLRVASLMVKIGMGLHDPDTLVAVAVNTPLVNLNFAKPRDSPKVVLHGGLAGGVTDYAVVDLDAPNVN